MIFFIVNEKKEDDYGGGSWWAEWKLQDEKIDWGFWGSKLESIWRWSKLSPNSKTKTILFSSSLVPFFFFFFLYDWLNWFRSEERTGLDARRWRSRHTQERGNWEFAGSQWKRGLERRRRRSRFDFFESFVSLG